MKTTNFVKTALIFGAGFAAGAYYVYTHLRSKLGAEAQEFADQQIDEMRDLYEEKETNMDQIIEDKAHSKAIDIALTQMNLQRADGSSIYDTATYTYELLEPDRFAEIDEFGTDFLTYYKDGTLAFDIGGQVVMDPVRLVGPQAIDNIGKYNPDMIHVRNHLYRKDYEILRSNETYAEHYGVEPANEEDNE